jgi:acyl CoA:acetate/3-ketoacid CoA transferase beta subunit
LLREIAPGFTTEEVQDLSEAKLIIPPDLKDLKM